MVDRNQKSEVQRDIEFLKELKADLDAFQDGRDTTRLDALGEKLNDWIDELSRVKAGTANGILICQRGTEGSV